ncbi:MAG: hypothetical protein JW958_02065 [Candidatus Eisenbacteria bacterium]|nr:hypothetical protein [Candidatus Eisenbacteria bacterium]
MKKRILFLQLAIVILMGEAFFRFDEATLFFQGARFEFLESEPRVSALRTDLDEGTFDPDSAALRVMMVGDSFLFGGKANEDYIFSNQLREKLRAENCRGKDGVYVLDLSSPGANTAVNFRNFESYVERFRPQILLWVYSRNDVYEGGEEDPGGVGGGREKVRSEDGSRAVDRLNRIVKDTQGFFFRHLKTMRWALKTINTELKLRGVLVPGTQHYHLIKRSHAPDFGPWKESQRQLEAMVRKCEEEGIFVLVFNSPYLLYVEELWHLRRAGPGDRRLLSWTRSELRQRRGLFPR